MRGRGKDEERACTCSLLLASPAHRSRHLMPPLYDSQYPSTTDFDDVTDPNMHVHLPSSQSRAGVEEAVEEAG